MQNSFMAWISVCFVRCNDRQQQLLISQHVDWQCQWPHGAITC